MAAYEAKNYTKLIGNVEFSETLLKNHFTLYQGYVNNTNTLNDALSRLAKEGKATSPEFAEMKRRFGWEFDGMRLHELYFENLGGKTPLAPDSKLASRMHQEFGSKEAWEQEFRATGAMRGIGWAILYQDNVTGRLFNFWINEHDAGHPAGCIPILIMDVFEHAFLTDFGLKRADYINAFFNGIDWQAVESRLR